MLNESQTLKDSTSDIRFPASPINYTRREILRLSAYGLGTALLSQSSLPAAEESPAQPTRDYCTLGFSTYGMGTLTTEQAIKELIDIGYDAVELSVSSGRDADSAKIDAKRRRALRAQMKDSSLRLTSLMEHVPPTNEKLQKNALNRLKLATELAHDLATDSVPLVQTVLGGGQWEKSKHQLVEKLAAWVEIANTSETTIAIKPHRGGVLSQPAEAVWLFEQLGKPKRLRMVYDYSHYAFRELPLEETVQTALPYAVHVAVKDAVQKNNRVVFELPGENNTIDFAALFKQLYAGGYRGDFNCEVSGMVWGKPNYDPLAAARRCYTNMAKAMQEAGVERPA